LEELVAQSDIVSLHCPLTPETFHLVDAARLELMPGWGHADQHRKGALADASAVVQALKQRKVGYLGEEPPHRVVVDPAP
jgi:D-lactate dehydrogenase